MTPTNPETRQAIAYHNPDQLPSAGEPPWRFLVEGELIVDGDMRNEGFADEWPKWSPSGFIGAPPLPGHTYRTRRPLPAPSAGPTADDVAILTQMLESTQEDRAVFYRERLTHDIALKIQDLFTQANPNVVLTVPGTEQILGLVSAAWPTAEEMLAAIAENGWDVVKRHGIWNILEVDGCCATGIAHGPTLAAAIADAMKNKTK